MLEDELTHAEIGIHGEQAGVFDGSEQAGIQDMSCAESRLSDLK